MDEHLCEQVFRYAIRSDWNAYKTFQMVSKMTAVIADRVVGQHPIPESLKPDWQGNDIFPPLRHICNNMHTRFRQTVQLPDKFIRRLVGRGFVEAIVFKTKPQTVHITISGNPVHIEPHNGVVWLGMLPLLMAIFSNFTVSTGEPCEVDLIWHEYRSSDVMRKTWRKESWLKLSDQYLHMDGNNACIVLVDPEWRSGLQNWLSIYLDFIKWAEDLYDNRICLHY